MPRILIVDDEPGIRQSLKGVFGDEGFATDAVATGEDCLKKIDESLYDLVFLDLQLPDMSGDEVYLRLKEVHPDLPIVIITGAEAVRAATWTVPR